MFFEDEKENLESSDYLDDIELDLDEELDDESVSWEELLKEDKPKASEPSLSFDISQPSATVGANSYQPTQSASQDLDFFGDSDVIEPTNQMPNMPQEPVYTPQPQKKPDAFDVFGGDSDSIQPVMQKQKPQEDVFGFGDEEDTDDDLDEFDFNAGAKKSNNTAALLGILLAVILVGASIFYLFFGQNKSTNVSSLKSNNYTQHSRVAPEMPRQKVSENLPQDVPVVNEKEAKNLKAEKKVVVPVETAGRLNPFLPTFEEFGDNYYAGVPAQILAPPNAYGNDQDAQDLMQVSVSGILFDDVKPSAIITIRDLDYFVQKGDLVDDYKVIDINRQAVVIKKGTNIYKAGVGERFNQNVEVSGSAVYQAGGTWQYSLANDTDEVEVRSTSSRTRPTARNKQRMRTR